MKSQDIIVLLKLLSIHHRLAKSDKLNHTAEAFRSSVQNHENGVSDVAPSAYLTFPVVPIEKHFSVRALELETGISKTQISLSLHRMEQVGLQKNDRKLGVPKTNSKALLEFLSYGIQYVFPAKEQALARGIPTSIAAPVLEGKLMSAGELIPVWPYAEGQTKGLSVKPLHANIHKAIHNDNRMYAYLALTDAIRLGNARERNFAVSELATLFGHD